MLHLRLITLNDYRWRRRNKSHAQNLPMPELSNNPNSKGGKKSSSHSEFPEGVWSQAINVRTRGLLLLFLTIPLIPIRHGQRAACHKISSLLSEGYYSTLYLPSFHQTNKGHISYLLQRLLLPILCNLPLVRAIIVDSRSTSSSQHSAWLSMVNILPSSNN